MTSLVWEGCLNVRDLGGLPTVDGPRIRAGAVVRSDNVRGLSDAGWRSLVEHGVRRVVDLRFPEELVEDPPRDVPVEVVHVSLFGASRSAEWLAEFNEVLDTAATAEEYLAWSYLKFLDRYRHEFGRAVTAVARAPEGAVLVHCMGGKDRTGLVVALALRIAGVSIDDVAADYAATEANLAPVHAEWLADAPDPVERRRRELLLPAPASAMRAVLEELERRHGSAEEYLRACGVDDDDLARLRQRLVGSRSL